MIFSYLLNMQSHPSWVCGLKHTQQSVRLQRHIVTPFVGVWIETCSTTATSGRKTVTPFVGVWIETSRNTKLCDLLMSHPSWVCGLKLLFAYDLQIRFCHTLRGCVD